MAKNLPANAEDVRDTTLIPGSGRAPEEGMATYFSILTWRIPWTEEPGGLQSIWRCSSDGPLECSLVLDLLCIFHL